MKNIFKKIFSLLICLVIFTICFIFIIYNKKTFTNAEEIDYLTIEEMFDINNLYEDHSLWKSQHASSYDMNEGNLDGLFFYKQQNIEYTTVLLDAKGPGVVTRFWTCGYAEDEERKVIHIYVDGKLLVEGKALDFFEGKLEPFIKPYVGFGSDTGGGVYCYVPIVFQESILITAEYANYWNVDYTIFPSDTKVISTTVTEKPILPSWYENISHDINQMTNGDIKTYTKLLSIDEPTVLYQDSGSGVVEGLNLIFDGLLDKNLTMDNFSANGRWINAGGDLSFDSYINPDNEGIFIKWRVDAIWANQVVDIYVDDNYIGRVDSGMACTTYRYKDQYISVPKEYTLGKSKIRVRFEAISTGGIDIPFIDFWVYSKLIDGTILSTYFDLYNTNSEKEHNLVFNQVNGGGIINSEKKDNNFILDLANYDYPLNSESINKTDSLIKTNNNITFDLNITNLEDLLIRRTTLTNYNQYANIYVNNTKVGNWNLIASESEGIIENYYNISSSYLKQGKNTIKIECSNYNYFGNIKMYQNSKLIDTINLLTDTSHNIICNTDYIIESSYSGVTTLKSSWQTIKERILNAYDSFELLDNTYIRVYYGKEEIPSIDESLSILLGIGKYNFYQTQSITQGIDNNGVCYFYLPISYDDGVRIELVSKLDSLLVNKISYKVSVNELDNPSNLQKLMVKTTHYESTKVGESLEWLNVEGSGKLVGIEINAIGNKSFEYLEGDEIVCVDNSKSHIVYGTGTEDIINSAWYFVGGCFTQAFHGAPTVGYESENLGHNSMYAWYILNQINFRSSIFATVEHGPQNLTQDENTYITAFYYYNRNVELEKICDLDINDGITSCDKYQEVEGRLEGNYSQEYIISTSRKLSGVVTYQNITIPENNNGLIIRRLFSLENTNQIVKVYLNEQYIGLWYNNYNRAQERIMRYDDYIISPKFTFDLSNITIRFETIDDSIFDEISYELYSIGYSDLSVYDQDNDGIIDVDDEETIIINNNLIIKSSYQDLFNINVNITDSKVSKEEIDKVINIIGNSDNVKLIDTFDLNINKDLNYNVKITNKNILRYENSIIVRITDEYSDIINVYNEDYLSFDTNLSGIYLYLYIK